ncbi:NAD(P)-dependent oxidoreductase [Bacillus xiamenensis]|uniref:NAD(P)-dependent oxidoreductase n=1 Tax=Bacillus xiamenensis TaxID=1178537 RepID=A0AAC9NCD1_9BACI|nr:MULTISPECIES: SDR family oxidoreductase [Bacillus]AOZ90501.1 NAD(P)-dependent oxidoreductase [Bacillus xiamenensis]MBG9912891.1 NmrA family protein [Bacillus xiamenensis]MCY9576855.1 SDR family oxidoreductase [Bacillus xiamenensis]QGX65928.1 NAD(P)H-binding protein [Bacillus sp. ms-22]
MKLLVTGATGQLGSLVVKHLLAKVPAEQIAVSVRNPEKAVHLKEAGVDVRKGDFTQPDTLQSAFEGVDRLLIISTADGDRVKQHTAAIEAAKAANVSFIAYTSVANARESQLVLASDHAKTEEAILASGIPHVFLRNNWYLENEKDTILASVSGAPFLSPIGEGKVGWATRNDYAEAAANALTLPAHDKDIYELSGPLRTHTELAQMVSKVSGKDIKVEKIDVDTFGEFLASNGVPKEVVPFFKAIQSGVRDGALAVESNDFETLLGRSLTPIEEAISELISK